MIDPAHLTDAELAAWYGSGLHAPKAQRLIEEVRRLRRELVLSAAQYAELERAELVREQERASLRARLAEVEAERGRLAVVADAEEFRAETAEARLAEVEAERDRNKEMWDLGLRLLREVETRLAEVEAERDQERKSRFVAYRLAGEAQARLAGAEALREMAIPLPEGVQEIDPSSAFDIGVDAVQLALGEILAADIAAARGEDNIVAGRVEESRLTECPSCAACDACDGSCGVCPYADQTKHAHREGARTAEMCGCHLPPRIHSREGDRG